MLEKVTKQEIAAYLEANKDTLKQLPSFIYLGESYAISDNVALYLNDTKNKPMTFFAKLLNIYMISDPKERLITPIVEVQFYFTRVQLDSRYKSTVDHISLNELFFSNLIEYVPLNALIGKFKLYSLENYVNSLEDHDIKFCQSKLDIHSGNIEPKLDSRKKVCTCRKIENPDFNYIFCDTCDQWFHYFCVGILDNTNVSNFHFKCKQCEIKDK